MKLIVGLGNPGQEYRNTRHNIGFMVLDFFAKEENIAISKNHSQGIYGKGVINGETVILFKPLTYMNLSGNAVQAISTFFKIESEDLIIVYDDLAFNYGTIKLRETGSAGGHNGMKDIILKMGTEHIKRIRIGIDSKHTDKVDFVLSNFSKEEMAKLPEILETASDALFCSIRHDFSYAMNMFNKNDDN